jgi:hypothetical protein
VSVAHKHGYDESSDVTSNQLLTAEPPRIWYGEEVLQFLGGAARLDGSFAVLSAIIFFVEVIFLFVLTVVYFLFLLTND